MRQKVIDGVLHIEVHEPPAGLNIDVPMGTRAVDCLSGAYWQRVQNGQWWLVGEGDPHVFKEVGEGAIKAEDEDEDPEEGPPTLEEVLAAGYLAPAAHRIVARERALADGLTEEDAWALGEQAVAAYYEANPPPPSEVPPPPPPPPEVEVTPQTPEVAVTPQTPEVAVTPPSLDGDDPIAEPADSVKPDGDGAGTEPADPKKGWLSGVLGGKSSESKPKKRRGG